MSGALENESYIAKGHWLFGLLCLVTFSATLTTGRNVFDNAWLLFGYEALFVVAFLPYRLVKGIPENSLTLKSVGLWLVVAWLVSVTYSLMMSPYGLMMSWFAVTRYIQTIFHIAFFLCLKSFFADYRGSTKPLFFSMAASVAILSLGFVGAWFMLDEPLPDNSKEWFRRPPFNAHIRITGFLVASATVALAPYFSEMCKRKSVSVLYYMIGLLVWGLMFWCGGRGSILSSISVCLFIGFVLWAKKQPIKRYLIALIICVGGGIILAELFNVFYWNGIFQAAERTIAAGGDPRVLSTGRTKLWGWVIESLNIQDAWMFGLGSQGYCFMPNRTFGFQPHNLVFQFLAEWGIVGCILSLAMIAYGFFAGAKVWFKKSVQKVSVSVLAALGVILSLGIHSLVDGIFYHAQPSMHLAIAFAMWMSCSPKGNSQQELT